MTSGCEFSKMAHNSNVANMSLELAITAERVTTSEWSINARPISNIREADAELIYRFAHPLRSLPYPTCIEPMLRTRCDCKFNGTAAVVQGRRQGPEPAALLPPRGGGAAAYQQHRQTREGRGRGRKGQSTAADSCGPGRATAPVEINCLCNSLTIPTQDAVACTPLAVAEVCGECRGGEDALKGRKCRSTTFYNDCLD